MAKLEAPRSRQRPADFEATFIEIGWAACLTHYRIGYVNLGRWMAEGGKERLLRLRAERLAAQRADMARKRKGWGTTNSRPIRQLPPDFRVAYARLGPTGCRKRYNAGRRTIERWLDECGRGDLEKQRAAYLGGQRMTLQDMSTVLSRAFPVKGQIGFATARHAAQHLRIRRNGGHVVSPAGDGLWWFGTKRITETELVELAKATGFDPNMTADLGGGS